MRTVIITCLAVACMHTSMAQKRKAGNGMPYVDDARPDTRTEYFIATLSQNDTAKIGEYIAAGININVRAREASTESRYYYTVLMSAIDRCNLSTVEYLLRHGADPNLRVRVMWNRDNPRYEFSMYPLEAAAEANSVEKMDLLIRYGADITKCIDGLKEIAANKGNTQMMSFISGKTGVSAIDKNAIATMTMETFEHDPSKVTPAIIDELVAGGADVNAYCTNGNTALINIIENKGLKTKIELIKALIKHKANVGKTDREPDDYKGMMRFYSNSPLMSAVKAYDLAVVKVLVENGADVNQNVDGYTALHFAQSDEMKEYLILKGAK